MIKYVTVERSNDKLKETFDKIKEIQERYKAVTLDDTGHCLNQTYVFANQFQAMLQLALVMTKGALLRDEFRGSHYKPEFPERDDKNWLKSTIATFDRNEPTISYRDVDIRHLKPLKRDYVKAKRIQPHFRKHTS